MVEILKNRKPEQADEVSWVEDGTVWKLLDGNLRDFQLVGRSLFAAARFATLGHLSTRLFSSTRWSIFRRWSHEGEDRANGPAPKTDAALRLGSTKSALV